MTALDFPNSPTVGQTYAPGGGALTYLWDGTRWRMAGSSTPASSGMMGYAQITANIAGYTGSMIDVYGLSITFNAVIGRTYKVSGEVFAQCNTANTIAQLGLMNGPGSTLNLSNWALPAAASNYKGHIEHVFTASVSASITLKLMFCTSAGTGTIVASPTFPGFILAEDITYQPGGSGGTAIGKPIVYMGEFQTGISSANGVAIAFDNFVRAASVVGFAQFNITNYVHSGSQQMDYALRFTAPGTLALPGGQAYAQNISTPQCPVGAWLPGPPALLTVPCTPGVKPQILLTMYVGVPGQSWYYATRFHVIEYPT